MHDTAELDSIVVYIHSTELDSTAKSNYNENVFFFMFSNFLHLSTTFMRKTFKEKRFLKQFFTFSIFFIVIFQGIKEKRKNLETQGKLKNFGSKQTLGKVLTLRCVAHHRF